MHTPALSTLTNTGGRSPNKGSETSSSTIDNGSCSGTHTGLYIKTNIYIYSEDSEHAKYSKDLITYV